MKKILSVFLSAFLLLAVLPPAALAEPGDSGVCGDDVTWCFDPETGELLISGSGPMYDFFDPLFCDLSDFQTLTIEAGVTSIGYGAFSYCVSLTDVTIPDSVTEIGDSAFSRCEALECITIPDSVTDIGPNAFEGCSSLSQATLGSGITSVADELFSGCCALTDVVIPETVTQIGNWSFLGCSSLVSVTVPNSVESIGEEAFSGCEGLQDVTIGNHVTTIGRAAFFNCSALESIKIPDSVTCIEEEAFADCTSLKNVSIGSGVGMIGANAFSLCSEELEIYYAGSREAWEAISISEPNEALLSAEIHCNAAHEHVVDEAELTPVSDATCTAPAFYLAVTRCAICGEELFRETIEDGEPLGHAFGAWETAATPTCTLPGEEQRSCSRCGAVETQTIVAPGHTPRKAERENETPAACETAGSYDAVICCSVCGDELSRETQTIPASGHTPGEAVHENETPAACETAGSYDAVIYCSICGDELSRETQTLPASGHTPGEAVRENETPAACETAGSYEAVVYCTVCGDELSRETKTEGKPLDHDWDEGVVTLAPTCSDCGTQVFTCKRAGCGQTEEKELKPVPGAHVWKKAVIVPPTCVDRGYTSHACARCRYGYSDNYVEALGHSFTVYSSNHDATCTADGTKTATCDRCTETNTIADKGSAFGHRPGKPVRENEKAAFCETDGSYDEVVYCTKCRAETGRTTHKVEKLGHVDTGNDGTCDRCGRQMTGGSHCAFCGKIHGGAFGWLIRFFHRILARFR